MDDLLSAKQIAGVYSGFKRTKIEKREKVGKKHKNMKLNEEEKTEEMEVDEEEIDEVNELLNTEGDEELVYKTEPLFDEEEEMMSAIVNDKEKIINDPDENQDTAMEDECM